MALCLTKVRILHKVLYTIGSVALQRLICAVHFNLNTVALRKLQMKAIETIIEVMKKQSVVRLWTIQPWEVWEEFQSKGILRGDGRRVDPEFRFAYKWMMGQMKKRLPDYTGRYPIWVWCYPKPDLRRNGYLPAKRSGVRIECLIPQARVLLSDFDTWHCVLNPDYIGLSQGEEEVWQERLLQMEWRNCFERYQKLPPNLKEWMEESWERIFGLEELNASKWTGPIRYIQGVLEEIYIGEVARIKIFTAG